LRLGIGGSGLGDLPGDFDLDLPDPGRYTIGACRLLNGLGLPSRDDGFGGKPRAWLFNGGGPDVGREGGPLRGIGGADFWGEGRAEPPIGGRAGACFRGNPGAFPLGGGLLAIEDSLSGFMTIGMW